MRHVSGSGSIVGHGREVFVERVDSQVRFEGTYTLVIKIELLVKGFAIVGLEPALRYGVLSANAPDLFRSATIEAIEAVFVASDGDGCSC
jgi:hypothetical protein